MGPFILLEDPLLPGLPFRREGLWNPRRICAKTDFSLFWTLWIPMPIFRITARKKPNEVQQSSTVPDVPQTQVPFCSFSLSVMTMGYKIVLETVLARPRDCATNPAPCKNCFLIGARNLGFSTSPATPSLPELCFGDRVLFNW